MMTARPEDNQSAVNDHERQRHSEAEYEREKQRQLYKRAAAASDEIVVKATPTSP
jgi:hypothetical protein